MQITCPKCSHVNPNATSGELDTCPSCGLIYSRYDAAAAMRDRVFRARKSGDWSSIPADQIPREYLPQAVAAVVAVTTPMVPGRVVAHVVDMVSAECVYGMNVLRDIAAGITDVVGGRSTSAEKVLRDARSAAMMQMKAEALMRGADAVIGVDLDVNEISGGGKTMLFVMATGTAVKLVAAH